MKEYLPIGSVVLLKKGTKELASDIGNGAKKLASDVGEGAKKFGNCFCNTCGSIGNALFGW